MGPELFPASLRDRQRPPPPSSGCRLAAVAERTKTGTSRASKIIQIQTESKPLDRRARARSYAFASIGARIKRKFRRKSAKSRYSNCGSAISARSGGPSEGRRNAENETSGWGATRVSMGATSFLGPPLEKRGRRRAAKKAARAHLFYIAKQNAKIERSVIDRGLSC